MDIEFHYYITYLIAVKAGFSVTEATTIAHSSQYIDDNDIRFEIDKGKSTAYRNYISQTMNILKPKMKLMRIYPIFHFIPGDPKAKTAWRKDGKLHWLNTTPNSDNANRIIDMALVSGDLHRIGIAAHGYVDTWAHQNFTGYYDEFNAMAGTLNQAIPNIGHADARHNPDWPALVWKDTRLLNERVDNKVRFLEAAGHLYRKFIQFVDPSVSDESIVITQHELITDLDKNIGGCDQANARTTERIGRYEMASLKACYGGSRITPYDSESWFEEVVNENVRGLRDKSDFSLTRWDPFTDIYTWKDASTYKKSDWYKFQEAVKAHQLETWEVLEGSNLKGLELEAL